jgi:hypothetical protein
VYRIEPTIINYRGAILDNFLGLKVGSGSWNDHIHISMYTLLTAKNKEDTSMPRRSSDNVSLSDKLVFIFGAIGVIPITVISCLARRLWTSSDYRLRDDIFLACVRR